MADCDNPPSIPCCWTQGVNDRELLGIIAWELCQVLYTGIPPVGLTDVNIVSSVVLTVQGDTGRTWTLDFATDQVDVTGSTVIATGSLGRTWDLGFATDQVDASGSAVSITNFPASQVVTATDLDIRNLVFATDKVDASGSTVSPVVGTTGGATPFRNAAVTNTAVSVKASAGRVWSYNIFNPGVALAYLHFYDLASGGVIVGTTVPTRSVALQSNATSQVGVDSSFAVGIQFSTAISIAASTTPGGGTAPGTALVVNIDYA